MKRSSGKIVVFYFLSDPGVPGVRSMGLDVSNSLTTRGFADLADVTLADEDSNSIPTDDVNRALAYYFLNTVTAEPPLFKFVHQMI